MGASTATWLLHISSGGLQLQCFLNQKSLFVGNPRSIRTNLILPRHPFSSSSVRTFARRRVDQASSSHFKSKKQKKKEQISPSKGAQKDEDEDEDAFEALFHQLEEDLKNDDLSLEDGDDDDISEEDLAKLERELEEALKDDELLGALDLVGDGKTEAESEEEEEEEEESDEDHTSSHHLQDLEDDDEDEEVPVKLKNWQLKRLAYALKNGRRKTNIKNLAADLCLDRAVVLQLLRDPPPDLLMMSAALPDKPVSTVVEPVNKITERVPLDMAPVATKAESEVKVPVHVQRSNWSAKKRIKKAQLDTLERVYNRTKRPTQHCASDKPASEKGCEVVRGQTS